MCAAWMPLKQSEKIANPFPQLLTIRNYKQIFICWKREKYLQIHKCCCCALSHCRHSHCPMNFSRAPLSSARSCRTAHTNNFMPFSNGKLHLIELNVLDCNANIHTIDRFSFIFHRQFQWQQFTFFIKSCDTFMCGFRAFFCSFDMNTDR